MAPLSSLGDMTSLFRRKVDNFQYYYYSPSLAAAILFAVLFGIVTIANLTKMILRKRWYMIPFIIGGICEVVGYISRCISTTQTPNWTLGPFVIQAVLLLVAPALFAASVYMQLGRIVKRVDGEPHLFIRRTWMTKIFVTGDIISFLMQGGGGGLESGRSLSDVTIGSNVIVGGLFVQIVFFGLFVLAALLFDLRIRKHPKEKREEVPYTRMMTALYIISVLVFIRSIVRVVEFLQGYGGYVMAHEVFLYVFDGMLMWGAMCAAWWGL
jgi:hypothetical protein